MLPIPDLLNRTPALAVDEEVVHELLGLAFLGKETGTALDDTLAAARIEGFWNPEFFAKDLFVRDLVEDCFRLRIGDVDYPINTSFLCKALANVPVDRETIALRQAIVRELDRDATLREATYRLYKALFALLSLFKTPGYQINVDVAAVRLEILKQVRFVVDWMTRAFADAQSGLRRLHEAGMAIHRSREYKALSDLLEYEQNLAQMTVRVTVGGDGKIKRFALWELEENEDNQFHSPAWKRFLQRWSLRFRGYQFSHTEVVNRLVNEVFRQIEPSLPPMIQLLGHLEFYLTNLTFRAEATAAGLNVSLAQFDGDAPMVLKNLFNPLLLRQDTPAVPCSIRNHGSEAITIVTGPNSGGKTRLLQAIGLAQMLGQSGLYTPATEARLPLASGLYVSLVEDESANQTEGRLGRELVRIRSLFEQIRPGSVVVLDELCSGTNPSEGVELFALVLKLLRRVDPMAFVTTHFLDFARSLQDEPPIEALEFLQVEIDEGQSSTYQFVPGVASTSLAALTAQRLGVTFERLSSLIPDAPRSES